mgnify:CR=1 FL=1
MVDVRLHKSGALTKVPHAFVVFDSEEPVKHLLSLPVIFINYPTLVFVRS